MIEKMITLAISLVIILALTSGVLTAHKSITNKLNTVEQQQKEIIQLLKELEDNE